MWSKKQKTGWLLTCYLIAHSAVGQVSDNFSDGNFTSNPAWSGETGKFEIVSERLHLNDVGAGEAYLSTPSEAIANAEWTFFVEITENPSSTNFISVYLASDQSDLSGELQGYFVKIGNTDDEVSLYRQDGNSQTEIIDGTDDRVNSKPVQIEVRVTRDAAGNWELISRPLGDTDFSLEGSVQDDTYHTSNYFGVYCKYTSTRKDAFYFDDIMVTGSVQPDTQHPQITNFSVLSDTQLRIQFSETVTAATAEAIANYTIPDHTITSATLVGDVVTLSLSPTFTNATDYTLGIRNIADEAANLLSDTTLNFFYFEDIPTQWNDVIISELTPDPNPVKDDLPDAEFIELYNRSEHPFDLQDWTLNGKLLPTYILHPKQYVILCATTDSAAFTTFGSVLSLSSWPTLSNSGSQLLLQDAASTAIDSLSYSEDEVVGGVSLERIRKLTPCDQRTNLALSSASRGATPGQSNTATDSTPDVIAPQLLVVKPSNAGLLQLVFDERVSDNALSAAAIQLQPSRVIDNVARDITDEKVIWVALADKLQNGSSYLLTFLNAQDCYGNTNSTQDLSFYFDNQPPTLIQAIVRDTSVVQLVFSEEMESSSATEKDHYWIDSTANTPKSIALSEDSLSVLLSFSISLDNGKEHQLKAFNLKDLYGNTFDSLATVIRYHQAIDTAVVISEYQVDVYFEKSVLAETASTTENFAINREVGRPLSSFLDDVQLNLIHLVLSKPLVANREHELSANQLLDDQNNLLSTPIYRFFYDRRPPVLDSVVAVNERTLLTYFNEPLAVEEATNVFHYQLEPQSSTVTKASLLGNQQVVQLTLDSALVPEAEYKLEVLGIADQSGNIISSSKSRTFMYDQHPPRLISWKIANPYELRLHFSEAVALGEPADYHLEAIGLPDSISVSRILPFEVRLFFTNPLAFNKAKLVVNQISDLSGNSLDDPLQTTITNAKMALGQITVLSASKLQLDFSQNIDQRTTLEPTLYWLNQTQNPSEVSLIANQPYVLQLSFDPIFQPEIDYELAIDQLINIQGSISPAVQDSFVYQTQVSNIEVEKQALLLHFKVPLDSSSAVQVSHYHLEGKQLVAALWVDEQTVRLVFDKSFEPLTRYELTLSGLQTTDQDIIPESAHIIGLGRTPTFNELLITEIMADPTPAIGLPEAEYLELYNASDDLLSTAGLQLSDATSSALFPTALLLPGEYLIVSATANQTKLSAQGNTIGISNFPSLNSTGDDLRITDAYGQVVFSVSYSNDWYNDTEKKQGGWSLEMIDYTRPCGERDNWTASEAVKGGTPGQVNSVHQPNPDRQAPYLLEAFAVSDTLMRLRFSEKIDPVSLSNAQVTLSHNLILDTILWEEDRKTAKLVLANTLQTQVTYSVQVGGLTDCSGNEISQTAISFMLSEEAHLGDVLLSELLFYPRAGGVHFVEIYNTSDKPINLKDWRLANLIDDSLVNRSAITEDDYQLAPHQYLALTEDITILIGDYPSAVVENILIVASLPSLPSDGGSLVLISPTDERMQLLEYDEQWHHPVLNDVRGVSLERIDWDAPVNDAINWQSAAQTVGFATPGYANSQAAHKSKSQAALSVEPRVFTPDQDGLPDYTQIHYHWSSAGNVANVLIFNSQGQKVRHLARNTTLPEQGFLRWDGTDDTQQIVPMGYYIIYFEVFHTNGQVSVLKERVVVGRPL